MGSRRAAWRALAGRWDRRRSTIAMLVVFATSRALAYAAGVRFDRSGLDHIYIQFVDPELLRSDYLASIWYLHMQPPLFNAFLGGVLQLPEVLQLPVFAGTFLALGVGLALTLVELLVELGLSRLASTAISLAFTVSPAAILYENWLFYTYPTAVLLAVGSLALLRWSRTDRTLWGATFFGCFSALALLRGTFHLAWLVAVVLLLVLFRRDSWRRTLALAAVPVLVAGGVYAKNAVLVGEPTVSMWQGMNLSLQTTFALSDEQRRSMIEDGELSELALIYPFQHLVDYEGLVDVAAPSGAELLDQPLRSDGSPNFNDRTYVAVDRGYRDDALAAIRAHPRVLVDAVGSAGRTLLVPAGDYVLLRENQAALGPWYTAFVRVVELRAGTTVPAFSGYPSSRPAILVVAVYVVAVGGVVLRMLRLVRRRSSVDATQLAVVVLGFTVFFHLAGDLLVGSVENNRFRFEIDPLVLSLAASFVAARVRGRADPLLEPAVSPSDVDRPGAGSRRPSSSRRWPFRG